MWLGARLSGFQTDQSVQTAGWDVQLDVFVDILNSWSSSHKTEQEHNPAT